MSNNNFDKLYLKLKKLGSPGGKIIGAGGGGFFMMVVPYEVDKYKRKINDLGYRILDWEFDFNGTKILED